MSTDLVIRTADAGDPEWSWRSTVGIYCDEFGFDEGFERDIAAKMDAFLAKDDPFKRLWPAERGEADDVLKPQYGHVI